MTSHCKQTEPGMQFIRVYLVLTESLTRVILHHVLVVAIGRGQVHSRRSKRQQGGQAPGIQTGQVTGTTHAPNSHRPNLLVCLSLLFSRKSLWQKNQYPVPPRLGPPGLHCHRTNYLVFLHSFGLASLSLKLCNRRLPSSKRDIHWSTI